VKNRYSTKDIKTITNNRSVFFDANVLIYIFWPTTPSDAKAKSYSSIFTKLLKNKNPLIINFVILSEVINRILKIEYERYKANNHEKVLFKQFRKSEEGRKIVSIIYSEIRNKIMRVFKISSKMFTKEDIESFLRKDSLDFNDNAIVSLCKYSNYVLCTHDADFTDEDIDIISSNSEFFKTIKNK